MFFFKSRELARQFCRKANKKLIDFGKDAAKRWAVKVL